MGGILGDIGGGISGFMGMLGIGPNSAAAMAQDAAAQNQAQAEVTAAEAKIRASTNLMEQQQMNRATEGAQRAAIGGSGVTQTGSALDTEMNTYAEDQFKDQVAVFNGLVNVSADQANAIAQGIQGKAAAAGANASAVSSDAGIATTIAKLF